MKKSISTMASAAKTSETDGDLLIAVYATAEYPETDAEEIEQQLESNSIYI